MITEIKLSDILPTFQETMGYQATIPRTTDTCRTNLPNSRLKLEDQSKQTIFRKNTRAHQLRTLTLGLNERRNSKRTYQGFQVGRNSNSVPSHVYHRQDKFEIGFASAFFRNELTSDNITHLSKLGRKYSKQTPTLA